MLPIHWHHSFSPVSFEPTYWWLQLRPPITPGTCAQHLPAISTQTVCHPTWTVWSSARQSGSQKQSRPRLALASLRKIQNEKPGVPQGNIILVFSAGIVIVVHTEVEGLSPEPTHPSDSPDVRDGQWALLTWWLSNPTSQIEASIFCDSSTGTNFRHSNQSPYSRKSRSSGSTSRMSFQAPESRCHFPCGSHVDHKLCTC